MTTAPFAIDRQPETRTLDGDRPLLRSQDDRLGFSQVAAALSRAILNQAAPEGLVIGVEGDWGSGKSSLLRLTLEQLAQGGAKRPPAVIEFRPWLIGDRDALLQALFSEFANALERLGAEEAGPARGKLSAAEAAGKELRAFAARLGGVGKLVKLGGDFVPGLGAIGSGLVAVSEVAADVKAPSLVELKTRIDGLLRDLQRTIVVTIDDVDRLEPSEALELLRLVRSVADFPHVVYLLCYDRHVLSAGIETSARVPDGEAFLEKILQVTVEVPLPEAYRLRTWFQAGLAALMTCDDPASAAAVDTVVAQEGDRYLKTPRDVVRSLNALQLLWPTVADKVDPADFVWIQMIKVGNPALYRWIERYLGRYAGVRHQPVGSRGLLRLGRLDLVAALKRDGLVFDDVRRDLAQRLPGIPPHSGAVEAEAELYGHRDDIERDRALSTRRLSSPDHWRLYFALDFSDGAARPSDIEALVGAAEAGVAEVGRLLATWFAERSGAGVVKGAAVLDQVRTTDGVDLTGVQAEAVFRALAEIMDEVVMVRAPQGFTVEIEREAAMVAPVLARRIAAEGDMDAIMLSCVKQGEALSWLAGQLRAECFAHGKFTDRYIDETTRKLSPEGLDQALAAFAARLVRHRIKGLAGRPQVVNLLWLWKDVAGEAAVEVMRRSVVRTQGLFEALEMMSTVATSSSRGGYLFISASLLKAFFNPENIAARLVRIGGGHDLEEAQRAVEFQDRIQKGQGV